MQHGFRLVVGSVGDCDGGGIEPQREFLQKGVACAACRLFNPTLRGLCLAGDIQPLDMNGHVQAQTQVADLVGIRIGSGPAQQMIEMPHHDL